MLTNLNSFVVRLSPFSPTLKEQHIVFNDSQGHYVRMQGSGDELVVVTDGGVINIPKEIIQKLVKSWLESGYLY